MTTEEPTPEPDEAEPDKPEPAPEPDEEASDSHTPPLDDEEDARFLDPVDQRRREAEAHRGQPFDRAD